MVSSQHERLAWLRLHAWSFTELTQSFVARDGRVYQLVKPAGHRSGTKRTVRFDVVIFADITSLARPADLLQQPE